MSTDQIEEIAAEAAAKLYPKSSLGFVYASRAIKPVIESVYNIGLAHGYEERAASEARLRAAHASEKKVAIEKAYYAGRTFAKDCQIGGAAHASERCWTEGGTADCLIHPKTDEADWAEDYDLTSFLHGDKTHAELIEANDNLFKIARKYCLENKSLRAEIKEKTK